MLDSLLEMGESVLGLEVEDASALPMSPLSAIEEMSDPALAVTSPKHVVHQYGFGGQQAVNACWGR